MRLNRVLEQHIAVFGESGSGKTVLVSSFYGATQEPKFLKTSRYDVTADDAGKGQRLYRNYLGMRDSARPPETTRFSSSDYAFSVKLREKSAIDSKSVEFDALRLVWHDYPGEWFEREVAEAEIAQRRIDTFRSLLGADVAFLLVDGQRLLDNAGDEERYLKALLGSFRTGILRLKDELLEDGKPLVRFPRIWVVALSKSDLLPDLDVYAFRDLVIGKAAEDLDELRRVLQGLVESAAALDVGEDFVLLSSAKFEPTRIDVTERKGLDLVLPLAAMLPLERHIKWIEQKRAGGRVVEEFLSGAAPLAAALIGKAIRLSVRSRVVSRIAGDHLESLIRAASELGGDQLKKRNEAAVARRDFMAAVLTRFQLDLIEAEEQGVLLRSRR